ncbi:hypothetical protein [Streptomyces sp. NPDC047718]|uniref:hypothetical protein n=1 Tax=Streptomyces sp. NPDC047718 TaxID=3155479 RepID=UPI0033EEB005
MTNDLGYTCSCCGEYHAELPMGYNAMAPDVWDAGFEGRPDSLNRSDFPAGVLVAGDQSARGSVSA